MTSELNSLLGMYAGRADLSYGQTIRTHKMQAIVLYQLEIGYDNHVPSFDLIYIIDPPSMYTMGSGTCMPISEQWEWKISCGGTEFRNHMAKMDLISDDAIRRVETSTQ